MLSKLRRLWFQGHDTRQQIRMWYVSILVLLHVALKVSRILHLLLQQHLAQD